MTLEVALTSAAATVAPPWLTGALVAASVGMFVTCLWSARVLTGWVAACGFAALALPLGWFAEQMGASRGWFFGSYHYTGVLGPRLGDVPVAIPLMWFALTWIGTVMASLMLWRDPVPRSSAWGRRVLTAWLAAMIVTAFDLGADPYFVFVLHAWIMDKTDGGWFGETLQGFAGWMLVSFIIILLAQWRVRPGVALPGPRVQRTAALLPMGIYGSGLVFQLLFGHPVETRAVAFFAMGLPLVAALAAWWWWPASAKATGTSAHTPEHTLDAANREADPLADQTVSLIVGPWGANGANGPDAPAQGLARLGEATRCMAQWRTNGELPGWSSTDPATTTQVNEALRAYLARGHKLPDWADPARIARAEALFMEQGPLSCTLLFCASLPQCYVLPQLAEVLHVAGQLEAHTEYRIRQTAAMIFPVMMAGGLTAADGSGIAQVLKVRLVHATIRHLILHGDPAQARGLIRGLAATAGHDAAGGTHHTLHHALLAHGWDVDALGMPCSQMELAYTLLTFSYVYLQGMRTMGLGLPPEDEEAYLHTWNVMGHVLGLRGELMAHTMDEAATLFQRMQARGRSQSVTPDPRPALGGALLDAMARTIRVPGLRGVPAPMTRWLIGAQAATDIGVSPRVTLASRLLFDAGRALAGSVDGVARLVWPQFSLSRLVTRVLGYHMLTRFLLDQTRPIGLPAHVLNPLRATVATWGDDAAAPRWMNWLEDRLTTRGAWVAANSTASAGLTGSTGDAGSPPARQP